jgi:acetate CoA/acetoacetate CoA-transferase alpha subunit
MKNKVITKQEAVKLFKDGMTVMFGGFLAVGTSEVIVDAVLESGAKGLTLICNDGGFNSDPEKGKPAKGIAKLIEADGVVKKLIASHIGTNRNVKVKWDAKLLEVELVPQGTLAERIRAGGAGLGGVLTPTGLGTIVAEGKQVINVDGKDFLFEKPLKADVAVLRGSKVDTFGNVVYDRTARNFNPIMALAANVVIAGADEIVERGSLDPDIIVTPNVLVDYIVKEGK